MSFLWPQALLLLALLPLAVAGYVALERRRRGRLAGLGTMGMAVWAPGADGRGDGQRRVRRWLAASLVLAGVATLVVALARPHATVGLPRQEGIVVLGHQDSHPAVAAALELPVPVKGEWIAVRLASVSHEGDRPSVELAGRHWAVAVDNEAAVAAPEIPKKLDL